MARDQHDAARAEYGERAARRSAYWSRRRQRARESYWSDAERRARSSIAWSLGLGSLGYGTLY